VSSSNLNASQTDQAEWTAGHANEKKFNSTKQFDRLVEAVMDGGVPAESLSEDLLRVVLAEAQRRQKTQRQSLKRRRRDKSGLDFESFRQRMFIEPSVASFVGPEAVAAAVALHNYTVVPRGEALCFVMKDPTAVKKHQRTAWACGLSGGIACDVAYFFSAGSEGIAIKHTSRILSKKKIISWSDKF